MSDLTLIKNWAGIYHGDLHKTAIQSDLPNSNKNGFIIVTRVNYITASIWLKIRNEKTKNQKGFIELPGKPNWLVMARIFRREQDLLLNQI